MTTDDELIRMRSENVPDTMNTRPEDYDLRDERLAEREELEQRVEEAITELDQRTPALEHPFEDLNGNSIEGEQPEIRDVRGEGLFRDDWTPPNSDMGLRFRIAVYGLDPENLGGTVHAIRQAEDPDAMRERILGIQYRSGFTVERILEDALIVGLLYLAREEEEKEHYEGRKHGSSS